MIVAEDTLGARLWDLFARRGFEVVLAERMDDVLGFATGSGSRDLAQSVAVVDGRLPWAGEALVYLAARSPRPILVGVVARPIKLSTTRALDLAFSPPLDPALLFAQVVKELSDRRAARGHRDSGRQARITGLIGTVHGNPLFCRMVEELETVLLPINAGAILEKLAVDIGTNPRAIAPSEARAIIESGQVGEALAPFASRQDVAFVVDRLRGLLRD